MKGKLNFVAGLFLGICLVTAPVQRPAVVETVTATLNRSPTMLMGVVWIWPAIPSTATTTSS